jgi:endonuclease YncB( thermonuclease family)
MKCESYLQHIVYHDTIPYIPPITCGKVVKVYDGDTITIATKLPYDGSPIYRFSVRINGIDCPEMNTQDHNEHVCANIAKQKVCDMIFNKIIHLKNVKLEKYGRILADVYLDDISVGEMLCKSNLAVKYDGGTKKSPDDWLEYYNKCDHTQTNKLEKQTFWHRLTKLITGCTSFTGEDKDSNLYTHARVC